MTAHEMILHDELVAYVHSVILLKHLRVIYLTKILTC